MVKQTFFPSLRQDSVYLLALFNTVPVTDDVSRKTLSDIISAQLMDVISGVVRRNPQSDVAA